VLATSPLKERMYADAGMVEDVATMAEAGAAAGAAAAASFETGRRHSVKRGSVVALGTAGGSPVRCHLSALLSFLLLGRTFSVRPTILPAARAQADARPLGFVQLAAGLAKLEATRAEHGVHGARRMPHRRYVAFALGVAEEHGHARRISRRVARVDAERA
jgi:hypothetical protein